MSYPSYPYRFYGKELPKTKDGAATRPPTSGLAGRFATLFEAQKPSLCQACHDRKIDFRPLLNEPSEALCDAPDDKEMGQLELINAVRINDFRLDQARAAGSTCSLCGFLLLCADQTHQEDWLLLMSCICTLRPRYDWRGREGEKGKVFHMYQIWVEFQPIEPDIVFDIIDLRKFTPIRKGRTAVSEKINLKLVKKWLQRCDEKHSHPLTPSPMVSHLQAIIDRRIFRVINTSTGAVEAMTSLWKYAVLSYVWGTAPEKSEYQPLESRPVAAYAPTIRDAATIARSIGLEYIWVDRICIDQTSKSEKAILIPYMKDIFAAAQLTIVAGCSDGAQSGLLGAPETPRTNYRPLVLGSSVAVLPASSPLCTRIDDCFWSKRGWTYEEHVFSKRLLYIFPSEVYFRCATHNYRESMGCVCVALGGGFTYRGIVGQNCWSYTVQLHKNLQNNPTNMSEVLEMKQFTKSVEEFSERNLTFESDRVAAFAGVVIASLTSPVDEVSERMLLTHGQPLHFFEYLLTWQHGIGRKELPIPDKPIAPSWSWPSSPTQVTWVRARDSLLQDRNSWFQYTSLPNHDIVGLPTKFNAFDKLVGLELPDELIASEPWMKGQPNSSSTSERSSDSSVYNTLALPKLHLITLVFDARFVHWHNERAVYDSVPKRSFVLASLGSTATADEVEREKGMDTVFLRSSDWSIHPSILPRYCADGVSSRPQPFETFALIAGRTYRLQRGGDEELFYDLYIMLLDPPGQHDVYTRVGMLPINNVRDYSYYAEVIRKGRPRWQHTCIA